MVGEVNTALAWQADSMTATAGSMTAAATSAAAAASSATLAGQKVGLAADQVALAVTAKNAAAASAASAQSYAQAAGASAGIPAPVANSFLGTDASGNSLWKTVTIPPSQAIGDILFTAAPPPDGYKLADGSVYLQASYAGWMMKFGPNPVSPATTRVVPSFVGSVPAGFSATKTLFSADASTGVILGNISTDRNIPSSQSFRRMGDVITLTDALPASTGYGQTVGAGALSGDGVYLMTGNIGGSSGPLLEFCKRIGDAWIRLSTPLVQPSSFNGQAIVCSADGVYWMYPMTQGQLNIYKRTGDSLALLTTIQAPNGQNPNSATAFSADGHYLLVCSYGGPYVSVYKRDGDVFSLMPAFSPIYASSYPTAGAVSADGAYIAVSSGSSSGQINIYKLVSGIYTRMQVVYDASTVVSIDFSADSKSLGFVSYSTYTLYSRIGEVWVNVPVQNSTGYGGGPIKLYKIDGYFNNSSFVGMTTYPYVVIYRDSYAFNPVLEFQVPFITQPVNQVTGANLTSGTKPLSVYAYVKVGESV
jgi:hypothetical protein